MSLQAALQWMQHVRGDEAQRQALRDLGDDVTSERLVALGAAAGFSFTAEELQQAHRHDWAMRWARYNKPRAAETAPSRSPSAGTTE